MIGNGYISLIIWINAAIAVVGLVVTPFPSLLAMHGTISLILLIPFGIVFTIFGVKLLKCGNNLFGHLKQLSYLAIATGIFTAVIFLMLFAILTSVALNIYLAQVFFKAAKEHSSLITETQRKDKQLDA